MKKRIFGFALMISILASLFVAAPIIANAETEGMYTYTVQNGEAIITKCSYYVKGNVEIPSTLGGYPVTAIGEDAFFDCGYLTGIIIPDSVTTIGDYAFCDCFDLGSITMGNGVKTIGEYAFADCDDVTDVIIGNNVTTIGEAAFNHCNSLSSVTIGKKVESISTGAFSGCYHLTNINVDENNEKYSSENGVLFNKDKTVLIQYPFGRDDTEYNIPKGVTSITSNAFYGCEKITHITIPGTMKTIDEYSFSWCENLKNVIILDGVTSIGEYAFSCCENLTDVTIPKSITRIWNSAFTMCSNITNVYYNGTENEWDAVTIGSDNEPLLNATIHFSQAEADYTMGDANGDDTIDIKDVISIRRFTTGGYAVEIINKAADVNKDNEINVKDVIVLRRYIVGGYDVEI